MQVVILLRRLDWRDIDITDDNHEPDAIFGEVERSTPLGLQARHLMSSISVSM